MDGHSRTTGQDFEEKQTRNFKLRLSFNEEASGRRIFVIHASTSTILISGGLHPLEFLEHLGFKHYSGRCPHYYDTCMYLETWELPQRDRGGFFNESQYAHDQFKKLAEDIEGMYQDMKNIAGKLSKHMELFPLAARYADKQHVPILDLSAQKPLWIKDYYIEEHQRMESDLTRLSKLIEHYDCLSYVLWGTGDPLVDAVLIMLNDVGFENVQKTEKGFTVDLIAEKEHVGRFAFEITGLNDAIKKKSPKLGQALDFIQNHRTDEKMIILANTFNDIPPSERAKSEQFTKDVLDLMQPMGITGMTCVDLYNIWKDTKLGKITVREAFGSIYKHQGGLFKYKT